MGSKIKYSMVDVGQQLNSTLETKWHP